MWNLFAKMHLYASYYDILFLFSTDFNVWLLDILNDTNLLWLASIFRENFIVQNSCKCSNTSWPSATCRHWRGFNGRHNVCVSGEHWRGTFSLIQSLSMPCIHTHTLTLTWCHQPGLFRHLEKLSTDFDEIWCRCWSLADWEMILVWCRSGCGFRITYSVSSTGQKSPFLKCCQNLGLDNSWSSTFMCSWIQISIITLKKHLTKVLMLVESCTEC